MKLVSSVSGVYRSLFVPPVVIEVDYGADARMAFCARWKPSRSDCISPVASKAYWEPTDARAMPVGRRRVACSVLELEADILLPDALRLLGEQELQPALLEELSGFDEHYPEKAESLKILFALGTRAVLGRKVAYPVLFEAHRGRMLDAVTLVRPLRKGDRVLGVRLVEP